MGEQTDMNMLASAVTGDDISLREALEMGADVAAKGAGGRTGLHYAALCGDAECVRILLAAGASPLTKDSSGNLPEDVALAEGHWQCERLLKENRSALEEKIALEEQMADSPPTPRSKRKGI